MSKRRRTGRFLAWLLLILIIIGSVVYVLPMPSLKATTEVLPAQPAKAIALAWPNAPETAIGAVGYGLLATNGSQTPRPIASTAKLITALTVLNKYPLTATSSGPTIMLTNADVALYNKYLAEQGSVAAVAAGEQITERQMLEAMMLPSANNMADSLAIWAFGSVTAYKTAATRYINSLGLTETFIGSDASGFLPDTKSSAQDLVTIGQKVLANPALVSIVAEKQAVIPVAGTIVNVNWLLGSDGIIGIKTGNTDQAGGVYVFAAKDNLDAAHSVTIVGSIVGSTTLADTLNSAIPLLNSAKSGFVLSQVATAGQVIGHYNVPWLNQPIAAVSVQNTQAVVWLGSPAQPITTLNSIKAPQNSGANIGQIIIKPAGNIGQVKLQSSIPNPPWWWRLIRHRF